MSWHTYAHPKRGSVIVAQPKTAGLQFDKPQVMGTLNVTPDSFYDGGRYLKQSQAFARAEEMIKEGARLIDIGGASARPGARFVPEQVELSRVIPVIEGLALHKDIMLSIDTININVMEAAIKAGARMVNSINALRTTGAIELVAEAGVYVCLMHMKGTPETMQNDPQYRHVVDDVMTALQVRIDACLAAGIAPEKIIIDPGFGFGKTLAHNIFMLREIRRLCDMGYPVMACLSRKSMLGDLIDAPPEDCLNASVAATALAVQSGLKIVRTHDIKPTIDAITIAQAVTQGES